MLAFYIFQKYGIDKSWVILEKLQPQNDITLC